MSDNKNEITRLLKKINSGDNDSREILVKSLYHDLKKFAGNILKKENQTITLQATELVNEAYLRMFDSNNLDWTDRTHFLSTAVMVMRRFLVDHARKKHSAKRIPKKAMDSLDEKPLDFTSEDLDIVSLDEALTKLESLDERQAKIVELRFFGGLSETEIGKILDISRSTVNREWMLAKMWLLHQINIS